jgi:hypothetical protein
MPSDLLLQTAGLEEMSECVRVWQIDAYLWETNLMMNVHFDGIDVITPEGSSTSSTHTAKCTYISSQQHIAQLHDVCLYVSLNQGLYDGFPSIKEDKTQQSFGEIDPLRSQIPE